MGLGRRRDRIGVEGVSLTALAVERNEHTITDVWSTTKTVTSFAALVLVDRVLFDEQANGVDLVLGIPLRWGMGFAPPPLDSVPWIPDEEICFWGGWGGSMIIMDVGRRMTISYEMNRMAPGIIGSARGARYTQAIYDAVRQRTAARCRRLRRPRQTVRIVGWERADRGSSRR
jgi:CubicO group peptidase (beta-lactamase class C family)